MTWRKTDTDENNGEMSRTEHICHMGTVLPKTQHEHRYQGIRGLMLGDSCAWSCWGWEHMLSSAPSWAQACPPMLSPSSDTVSALTNFLCSKIRRGESALITHLNEWAWVGGKSKLGTQMSLQNQRVREWNHLGRKRDRANKYLKALTVSAGGGRGLSSFLSRLTIESGVFFPLEFTLT